MSDDDIYYEQNITSLKRPPHSIEAEQTILGAIMIDPSAWERVADIVCEADFYRPEHRRIYASMVNLTEKYSPIDLTTLSECLSVAGNLENIGGASYLAQLATETPSIVNARAYAKVVREKSLYRLLISATSTIADKAFNPDGLSVDDVLAEAKRNIMRIAEDRPGAGGLVPVKPFLSEAVDNLDKISSLNINSDPNEQIITGITTGFNDLNELTSGFQKTDLIIVAARPSMGKTTFAMNLVENVILSEPDLPVLVFSMQMPASQLIIRLLSSNGRIDQKRLRTGRLIDEDLTKLSTTVRTLADTQLYIDDTPSLTPSEVRLRSRKILQDRGQIGMIMIDYIQIMTAQGIKEGRPAEISEISRSLKGIAKEFNCPVIALSQLNRNLDKRPNKRPKTSDLLGSGAIEQDADVIMFIYRDDVYNEDSEHKGIAEIIIGKQRNGPIDTIRLAFEGQYSRFSDLPEINSRY